MKLKTIYNLYEQFRNFREKFPAGPSPVNGRRIRLPLTSRSLTIGGPRNNMNKKSTREKI